MRDSSPVDSRSLQNSHDSAPFSDRFTLEERLYTPQEVADRLGVSERWVRDHATRRIPRIRAVKLGPLLRFREADVAAFVATQMTHLPRGTRGNV